MTDCTTGLSSAVSKLAVKKKKKNQPQQKTLMVSGELAGFCAHLYVFPSLKCGPKVSSHSLLFCFLQNVFNMVVEVPRWTNAKMEVTALQSQS